MYVAAELSATIAFEQNHQDKNFKRIHKSGFHGEKIVSKFQWNFPLTICGPLKFEKIAFN